MCPSCQTVAEVRVPRCGRCWRILTDVADLSPEDALAAAEQTLREGAATRRARFRRRVFALGAIGLLLLAGLIVFRPFRAPPPFPAPLDATRAMAVSADDWAGASGGPGTDRLTLAAIDPGLVQAWTIDLAAPVAVAPSANRESLIVALEDATLVAVNPDSGVSRWSLRLPAVPRATLALAGDLVFLAMPTGSVLAVEATTGAVRWEAALTRALPGLLIVDRGEVLVSAPPFIVALDAETGDQLWQLDVGVETAITHLAADASRLVVGSPSLVNIYDRRNGALTYWYDLHPVIDGVALDRTTLYVASSLALVAIDTRQSSRPWWEPFRGAWIQFWVWGSAPAVPPPPSLWVKNRPPNGWAPALGREHLFVADRSGSVTAFDRASGDVLWERQVGPMVDAPVATASGVLIPVADGFVVLDPEGNEVARQAGLAPRVRSVTVTGHGAYVVLSGGALTAFRAR